MGVSAHERRREYEKIYEPNFQIMHSFCLPQLEFTSYSKAVYTKKLMLLRLSCALIGIYVFLANTDERKILAITKLEHLGHGTHTYHIMQVTPSLIFSSVVLKIQALKFDVLETIHYESDTANVGLLVFCICKTGCRVLQYLFPVELYAALFGKGRLGFLSTFVHCTTLRFVMFVKRLPIV